MGANPSSHANCRPAPGALAIGCVLLTAIGLAPNSRAAELLITDLQDINLGVVPATSQTLTESFLFCISMNPEGPVQITAWAEQYQGRFVLTSGQGPAEGLPFRLYISSSRSERLGQELFPGVTQGGFSGSPLRRNGSCRNPLPGLSVVFEATDLSQAAAGNYQGTLELTVAPE